LSSLKRGGTEGGSASVQEREKTRAGRRRNSLPSRIDSSSNQISHSIRPPVSTLDTSHVDPATEPVLIPETAPDLGRRVTSGNRIPEESVGNFELWEVGMPVRDVGLDIRTDLWGNKKEAASAWMMKGDDDEDNTTRQPRRFSPSFLARDRTSSVLRSRGIGRCSK